MLPSDLNEEMIIERTEWLVLGVAVVHLMLAPATKVEESFNVQATHDLLFIPPWNLTQYDHMSFPGVVPRTFAGPIALAVTAAPFSLIMRFFEVSKLWNLILVRGILLLVNVLAFLNFARCVRKYYGEVTAVYLRIIVATQFHFLFYASRPLPNTFALPFALLVFQRCFDNRYESAVRWATASVFLFRCELVLLYAPLFLPAIFYGRLPLLGPDGAIINGVRTAVKVLAVTVPIDSYFWGRYVWPEGEVAIFNILLNKSHEYGTSPFLWYFYSALPRALLASLMLVPLGVILDRRLRRIVAICLIFVFLYSFLPHKELRFIIYIFPVLSLAAAVVFARMSINRNKGWIRYLLFFACYVHIFANISATLTLSTASARNYPGADAINYLQWHMRFDRNKPVNVYIDNACAQTGVNRFMQAYEAWNYNKTENLKPVDLKDFDFLLLGTYGSNLVKEVETDFSEFHRPMHFIESFHRLGHHWFKSFPYVYPKVQFKEKAVVMRNLNY
ncbi:unnamed protein product [Caenorhabditis auriculariae]|uniref:Mannosyltransferase n=1 Tax=Caenorhabditis auriculariae TaxID=2777116 RepID=A0A8S1HNU6_9PELO|nr:unnamed protein product [Caenorhabditis auriculariae]